MERSPGSRVVWVLCLAIAGTGVFGQEAFVRGDANQDGTIDLSDPVFVLFGLFGEGALRPLITAARTGADARRKSTRTPRATSPSRLPPGGVSLTRDGACICSIQVPPVP